MVTVEPGQSASPAIVPYVSCVASSSDSVFQNPENGFTVARLAPERPEVEAEVA